ncbi:hypothetical protein IT568_05320 [bacterium]|nr:hypothetical protein [bacterium]
MLVNGSKRGFSNEELKILYKNKVISKNENGFFTVVSILENAEVCIEDFYFFLEKTSELAVFRIRQIDEKLKKCEFNEFEKKSFFYAQRFIFQQIFQQAEQFYTTRANFSFFVSEQCFASLIVEKILRFTENVDKNLLNENIRTGENPDLFIDYLAETIKSTTVSFFRIPKEKIENYWQYSNLINILSKLL